MAFNYNGLWKILIDKKMMKKDLISLSKITSSTVAKMGKEQPVSMEILGRICEVLECDIGDIVEYIPKKKAEKE